MDERIKEIAKHYGYEPQSRQLIEEMAELTKAINKVWRTRNFPCTQFDAVRAMDNLFEEIADVEVMLEQIKYLMHCFGEVAIFKEQKIARQIERIEGKTDS